MSWHERFRLRDDVGTGVTPRRPRAGGPAVPLARGDEAEVKSTLQGLARRHDLTVAEVAKKLEAGLWSREHCLGGMRLQWAFEKMCDENRFSDPAAKKKPRRPLERGHHDPRAA